MAGNDASKRRLPSWMLGVGAREQETKQNEIDEKKSYCEKQQLGTEEGLDFNTQSVSSSRKKQSERKVDIKISKRSSGKQVEREKVKKPIHKRKTKAEGADADADADAKVLTVEDLLTIAQEYVKDTTLHESVKGECKQVRESLATNKSDHSSAVVESCEQNCFNAGRTGDPTQDMLDLLLGPFLRKPTQD